MTATATTPRDSRPGGLAAPADEGLRARKKRETAFALHRAAIELIDELETPEGPEAKASSDMDNSRCADIQTVTVEAIAARAGVSPRTFFNYYPTKDAAITFSDPELGERLAAWMHERPASESTVEAVRAVMLRRVGDLIPDEAFWRMRRRVTRRHPGLAAAFMGANALSDRAVAVAAGDRLGLSLADDLSAAAQAYAALGAIRAALWQHIECDLSGSLEARIDDALGAAGLLSTRTS